MADLPHAETEAQYNALDRADLRPAVLALCARLGLPVDDVTAFPTGSLPVYAVGEDRVLKLYPPAYPDDLPVERSALSALEGRLPIPTPRVHATGTHQGWGYLVMDRLHGESLLDAWPRIPAPARAGLAAELGTALAALHAVAPPAELGPDDWQEFLAAQRAGCVARQRALGLDEKWLSHIADFLDSVELPASPAVFLHTEFMPVHILLRAPARTHTNSAPGTGPTDPSGAWTPTGLFDFEPAMRGAPEYDLVAVGVFVTRGDPHLFRTFLTAYGYPASHLATVPRIVLAYALLHAHANLPWFLRETPAPNAATLDDLAHHWFGTE